LIDWPDDEKTGNFVISVMGGNSLYQELVENYNNKQIGSQQIEIRKLSKTLNISDCHVLYVSAEHLDLLPEIAKKFENDPILIVSDGTKALLLGAIISFISDKEQSRWLFELNESDAERRELYIGTTLKSLARKVQ
jgi:hypothetical protein